MLRKDEIRKKLRGWVKLPKWIAVQRMDPKTIYNYGRKKAFQEVLEEG